MLESITSIVSHTPAWVFVVFAVLIAIGARQMQPRIVSRRRLIVLPLVVAAYSLYGVLMASHGSPLALTMWLVAVLVAFLLTYMSAPSGAAPETASTVRVPGSWVPMVVIVGLFTARYAYNVMLAMHPEVSHSVSFMTLFSAVFGFLGGLLLSRSVLLHVRTPRLMTA
jgi:sterol desaturase/sphingolipid hydroxylase (fatty acid hydroxylase superfamily)